MVLAFAGDSTINKFFAILQMSGLNHASWRASLIYNLETKKYSKSCTALYTTSGLCFHCLIITGFGATTTSFTLRIELISRHKNSFDRQFGQGFKYLTIFSPF